MRPPHVQKEAPSDALPHLTLPPHISLASVREVLVTLSSCAVKSAVTDANTSLHVNPREPEVLGYDSASLCDPRSVEGVIILTHIWPRLLVSLARKIGEMELG